MANYLYIFPSVEIIEYRMALKQIFILQAPKQQIENRALGGQSYEINEIATEILSQFNGTKTYENIVDIFSKKYSESYNDVDIKIKELLTPLIKQYGFEIKKQDKPILHEIKIQKYSNVYPTVVSVELTDRCNVRCKHCYGNFCIEKANYIPKTKLVDIFKSMKDIGVLTVELTGGDPSVYPYTSETIEIAFDVGIQSVMLLTNGISLSEKLINTIVKYKDKMFVQIDLHSLDNNYYDWFTGSKGNLDYVKKNIDILVSKGVQVRTCSIITPKNYHEVEDIGEWSYKHGAKFYATSPVVEIGRAVSKSLNSDLMFTNPEELEDYLKHYDEVSKRHPGFIRGKSKKEKTNKNCGALTSQCSIKSNGDIKLCAMDTGEYFNLKLGNILEDSMKEIYDKNYDFLNALMELDLPRKESASCKDCKYALFCDSCLLRGFLRAQDINKNCNWYNTCIPNIVKERLCVKKEDILSAN
ncbi:Antilisterial bacteriocin subtilosin biosynthesis protein AlbA [Clostridium haemolyticum]|uniref:radical SAM/SPASM domain-containing protein n=1 Tax=Clostridium haemolyticum TaxID=84025 RepID=UPI001C3B56D8|nr:radical SAM protein [Clostridium haemolyticum]CAG7838724.1 Antilisterial bacteriocin subtilosin biosynthesis protein AlbA [Clostridium haemolyticum]